MSHRYEINKNEDQSNLNDILVNPLKRITNAGGDVLHALKNCDIGYEGFGEVYFSWVERGTVKAWKCHKRMTMNLIAPMGAINIVFNLQNQKNIFRKEIIGEDRYVRLTVPPGIWFGFQGITFERSLLMNIANITHDPEEVIHKKTSEFDYNWSVQ